MNTDRLWDPHLRLRARAADNATPKEGASSGWTLAVNWVAAPDGHARSQRTVIGQTTMRDAISLVTGPTRSVSGQWHETRRAFAGPVTDRCRIHPTP
jgi:hypothetical protein